MQRLNYLWRMLMTGLCFVVFGLGGWLMALLWFNALHLLEPDAQRRQQRARACISKSFAFFLRLAQWLGVLQLHSGAPSQWQALRTRTAGMVLVANHPTLLDYVMLAAQLPQLDCVVKASLWRNPFVCGVIRAAGYLPNTEGNALIDAAAARVQQGACLLIFPEGTRSKEPFAPKLQRGAAHIALRAGAPMQLVEITCLPATLQKGQSWYQIPPTKPIFRLHLGPLWPINVLGCEQQQSQQARELTRRLSEYYRQALSHREP